MKISLYFAQSLIMEKSPDCGVIQHSWQRTRSRKALLRTSRMSPRLTREEGEDLVCLLLKTAKMLGVYTDTIVLNRLTGEYRIIAKETAYDQLITSLTKKSFMLPFSPQLVDKLKDSHWTFHLNTERRIHHFNCCFRLFFFFFFSYAERLTSFLYILFVPAYKGTLLLWWISCHIFKEMKNHPHVKKNNKSIKKNHWF